MIRADIHLSAYAGSVRTDTPPIPALLTTWAAGTAGPMLTWYGPDADRIELTGKVLTNWVTKATNLLQEEADAAPGTRVSLDLPTHWRTLIWALATWNCGAEVVLAGSPEEAGTEVDVQVSAAADPAPAPVTISIALPSLARQVDELPAGAIDGAAELMAQPDVLILAPEWDPGARALGQIRHADLAEAHPLGDGEISAGRYLIAPVSPESAIRSCASVWFAGGSVVLVADAGADTARIAGQEDAQPLIH